MSIYQQIIDRIVASNRIVITAHQSPDGDSIGSSLGLYRFIKKMGKSVCVCHPDSFPHAFKWLPDTADILIFDKHKTAVEEKIADADLLFCLDYNHFSRVGIAMQTILEQFDKNVILIDHHLDPTIHADLSLSDPTCCSTSQLIYEVIRNSDQTQLLDAHIVEPLYMGIVTDTGSFRFDSVNAQTHRIVAEMLALGLQHNKVHENTFDNNSFHQLQLLGYAISKKIKLVHSKKIALIYLTRKELAQFKYQKGDTEGIVNFGLSISGVQVAVFLSEQDSKIRLSFRGTGNWAVNTIASEQFHGGGHKFAAGGTSSLSMNETIKFLEQQIPKYFPL